MTITYTTAEVTSISGDTLVYTVPALKTAIIMSAILGNTSGSASNIVSASLGGTPYGHNTAVPEKGAVFTLLERSLLQAGDEVRINATGSNLSLRLSIKEIQ